MELIADVLLVAGAFGAALYCHVLSRRLRRLGTLETGMGGAIAVLSAQVDDMTRALTDAQSAARESATRLDRLTLRAEASAQKLELMIASLHDLPEAPVDGGPRAALRSPPRVQTTGRAQPAVAVPQAPPMVQTQPRAQAQDPVDVALGAYLDPTDAAQLALHHAAAPPSAPPSAPLAAPAYIATAPAGPAAGPDIAHNAADGPLMQAAPVLDDRRLSDVPGVAQGVATADQPDALDLMAASSAVAASVPDQTNVAAPLDQSSVQDIAQPAIEDPRPVASAQISALGCPYDHVAGRTCGPRPCRRG